MAIPARRIEREMRQPVEQRTVLEERVAHIQDDVADLKADVRRVDAKCDALGQSLAEHRVETEKSFGALRADMKAMQVSLMRGMLGLGLALATLFVTVVRFLN